MKPPALAIIASSACWNTSAYVAVTVISISSGSPFTCGATSCRPGCIYWISSGTAQSCPRSIATGAVSRADGLTLRGSLRRGALLSIIPNEPIASQRSNGYAGR